MTQDLMSVEQVADLLGLHVRTVRNYVRDGRLKATRIGKQYRIARPDVEALTGHPIAPSEPVRRSRHVETSIIVNVDAISASEAGRVTNTLMAATNGAREEDHALRVDTAYDETRGTLKVILSGSISTTGSLLKLITALVEDAT